MLALNLNHDASPIALVDERLLSALAETIEFSVIELC
jgi:hypothetical protein